MAAPPRRRKTRRRRRRRKRKVGVRFNVWQHRLEISSIWVQSELNWPAWFTFVVFGQ